MTKYLLLVAAILGTLSWESHAQLEKGEQAIDLDSLEEEQPVNLDDLEGDASEEKEKILPSSRAIEERTTSAPYAIVGIVPLLLVAALLLPSRRRKAGNKNGLKK